MLDDRERRALKDIENRLKAESPALAMTFASTSLEPGRLSRFLGRFLAGGPSGPHCPPSGETG